MFFFFIQVVPVNVSCTRSEFTILISQQSLPQLDRESIYLGNPSCTAQLTPNSYKILAQFVNCGTAGQVTNSTLTSWYTTPKQRFPVSQL